MNPSYKKKDVSRQYKNSSNLNDRIGLHEKFSTNSRDWHEWLFDQLDPAPGSKLLELGCGSGAFWSKNRERISPDWHITLSDFSVGMLQDARKNLAAVAHDFIFEAIDAQEIPCPDDSFDVVFANHMLYHVPDRKKAISEIRRVLKPGGTLYVSTIGEAHMKEIDEWLSALVAIKGGHNSLSFGLENGAEQLADSFSDVVMNRFPCNLKVTEVKPLVAYILSMGDKVKEKLNGEKQVALNGFLEKKLAKDGSIHITKDTGFFTAR